jgi:hypothetical protein
VLTQIFPRPAPPCYTRNNEVTDWLLWTRKIASPINSATDNTVTGNPSTTPLRNTVRRDQLRNGRILQPIHALLGQQAVRHRRLDAQGPALLQQLGRTDQRARGGGQVVHQQHMPAFHLAHHVDGLHLGRALALLAHDGQPRAQHVGIGIGHLQAARVRRHHHQILQITLPQVLHDHRRGKQMVHRDIEKSLDLLGMEIHGHDAIRPRRHQQVRHQLGRDGHPGLVLAILPAVPVERDDRGDARRRRPLARIDHDQHFHDRLVRRITRGLDDKHILTANVVYNFDKDLTVREAADLHIRQLIANIMGDGLGQSWMRISC